MPYGPYRCRKKSSEYTSGMPVALEYDGDYLPALVGKIIAIFAALERHLPEIIARMTGMTHVDAVAICHTFRSFSGRMDILGALLKVREPDSHDKIVYSYCKGLFNEASKIRNKYAHATYAKGSEMMFSEYHHDNKPPDSWKPMTEEINADKERISIILGEVFAILHQKEMPPSLYNKLPPLEKI